MKLALKTRHIIFRHNLRMNVVLDRIVFRGQTESIPAHGIEHIVALHPPLSRHDIKRRIGARMSHMQSLPRGIGKLYQRIIFRFGVILRGLKRFLVVPDFLPLRLHFSVIVHFCHFAIQPFPAAVLAAISHRGFLSVDTLLSHSFRNFSHTLLILLYWRDLSTVF